MTVKIMIFCLGIVAVVGAVLLLILSKKQTSHLPQVANLFLTMRLDPQEQKEMAEYLNKRLLKDDLGQISLEDGSGYLTNADGEIISCDFDIRHEKMDKAKFEAIRQNLNKVPFFTKGSCLKWQGKQYPVGDKVILAIYLQKHEFAPEEFSDQALNGLIEKFCNTLGENCRYFSYWQDGKTTALYFYGKDHAVMQQSIAELLRTEKLCRNCKVVNLLESGQIQTFTDDNRHRLLKLSVSVRCRPYKSVVKRTQRVTMRKNNKFKIEDFQLSEELEAILRKGHRWRLGLVWIIFLTNVLWFGYLALCWSMDWQPLFNIQSPWSSMWPLILFLCSVDLYAIRLPGKCPQCQNKLAAGCKSDSVVFYCPLCRIYGKTGVKF